MLFTIPSLYPIADAVLFPPIILGLEIVKFSILEDDAVYPNSPVFSPAEIFRLEIVYPPPLNVP